MRLSPHFTLREAVKSQTAIRLGIDNTPSEAVIANLARVAEDVLEPVRAHFGVPFSPSSWYRCPALNTAIGSKPTSQHVTGRAVDLEVPGVSTATLARWCAEALTFDQLLLEFYDPTDPASGWVHCAVPADARVAGGGGGAVRGRGEVLTVTRNGVTTGIMEA